MYITETALITPMKFYELILLIMFENHPNATKLSG